VGSPLTTIGTHPKDKIMTKTTQKPLALITGGSRGLGRSMALRLAQRGVDVVITYREKEAEATQVVRALGEAGVKSAALRLDVGDVASFDGFVGALRGKLATIGHERVDYLVNNAGAGAYAPFDGTTEAVFDAALGTHVKGPFFLTQKLLPLLADGGRILNVSTGLTRFTMPGYAAYATAKGAIEVLSRYLAKELAPRGITVNTIAPGAIATDFGGGAVRDDAGLQQMIAGMTALGRVGEADDVGAAVAMLLSPDSGWITGQRIEISGGMLL
jgi:NAD(P)-dependent dehydrogenase (short-subunit alcohol dehydrogenase family)